MLGRVATLVETYSLSILLASRAASA
jgi:hypothetical protein